MHYLLFEISYYHKVAELTVELLLHSAHIQMFLHHDGLR